MSVKWNLWFSMSPYKLNLYYLISTAQTSYVEMAMYIRLYKHYKKYFIESILMNSSSIFSSAHKIKFRITEYSNNLFVVNEISRFKVKYKLLLLFYETCG